MSDEDKYVKAGKIAIAVKINARKFIKPGMLLLDIAEKMEYEIASMGGIPAFPVGLSCDDIAAHYSPVRNDTSVARGLLKVDFGVAVDGFPVDTAFSLDLSPEQKYTELVSASEEAVRKALSMVKKGLPVREIGREVHAVIKGKGFSPIKNLFGHGIRRYNLHADITIPSYDNNGTAQLENGVYAIEPFATNGVGLVKEGKKSEIMMLDQKRPVRDQRERKILDFIEKEYITLPFTARWITKRFGSMSFYALQNLEKERILYHFPQLFEQSGGIVSQAEQSVYIMNDTVKFLTLEDE